MGGVIFLFCCVIVDVIVDLVCVFKLQIVYFVLQCVEDQFEQFINYIYEVYLGIFVIFDVKCGDIGFIVEYYVKEVFECYQVDVIIVSFYMGFDLMQLYFVYVDKGVIVLCCMFNVGGSDVQFLEIDGCFVYQVVVECVCDVWNISGQMGLVVGVMFLEEIVKV